MTHSPGGGGRGNPQYTPQGRQISVRDNPACKEEEEEEEEEGDSERRACVHRPIHDTQRSFSCAALRVVADCRPGWLTVAGGPGR